MSELRQGFTTGSAAAAAAKAALLLLLGEKITSAMDIPLPEEGRLVVPLARQEREGEAVRVTVVKDAGDDPDVTHGAEIQALVSFLPGQEALCVDLDGGRGVGRSTLPGLAVQVGRAAINPGPQMQIEKAVREAAGDRCGTVRVLVEVPDGTRLAEKTMNPRLGIVGGISILGSHGIVRPYSHEAWTASVDQALEVARAAGLDQTVFTTGRKSERLYLELYPDTPAQALVQAADLFAHACASATQRGFRHIGWSLFFGKLVKQAQSFANTHAGAARIDFALLARWCAECGAGSDIVRQATQANTAREVLGLLKPGPVRQDLLRLLAARASANVAAFAPGAQTTYAVFDFDGTLLFCSDTMA
ncbi:MAG: cobalt-precorrin-5B (C(1))-methyltransferase CbiD [Desulfovibrionaceae bacterium]